jgi:hypothetical protein
MDSPPPGLTTLLARLASSGTDFVLVGALAAVAQGAPLPSVHLEIVHRRSTDNVDRLLEFLASIDARYRGRPAGQGLRPTREALLGTGHQLLTTDLGPLDLLGAIEGGRGYDDLVPESVAVEVEGERVKVLRLRMLAELKGGATSAKDQLSLAVLEETIRRTGEK